MTSKERIYKAVSFEQTDRIPSFFMAVPDINRRLSEKLFGQEMDESAILDHFDVDIRFIRPELLSGYKDKSWFKVGNVHAKLHKEDGHETVVIERPFLSEIDDPDDVYKSNCWPDPDWFNYEIERGFLERNADRSIVARGMGALFLQAMSVRGMQQILMDMALKPEIAHAIFSKITDLNCERIRRFLKTNEGYIDFLDFGDDIAGQSGMVFSLEMWRQFIKPQLQRMRNICLEFNVESFFFGCGGFSQIIDDLIEIGIKGVGRLQSDAAGNDFFELLERFGKRISLWGAVDAQHKLITGTQDEVKEYVSSLINRSSQYGFVIGPTHTFSEDTPIENICSMYEIINSYSEKF